MIISAMKNDIAAAAVGALTALPQAIAFGLIAFSPLGPDWAGAGIAAGVGTATLAGVLGGVLASHPLLSFGPAAVTAVVYAVSIQTALERGHSVEQALLLACLGVVIAGLGMAVAGLLRLGRAISYIPLPVLAGFICSSAMLVLFNSLPFALGLPGQTAWEILVGGWRHIALWPLLVGGVTVVGTLIARGRFKPIPAVLPGLIAGWGVYMVGTSAFGLPHGPEVGTINLAVLRELPVLLTRGSGLREVWQDVDIALFSGLSIGLLSAFLTVLSAGALELYSGDRARPNRDLCSHGIINCLVGVFGLLPGGGMMSRSQALFSAGARTRTANVYASLVLLFLVLALAPLLSALPMWALAAMLMVIAVQTFDVTTLRKVKAIFLRSVPYPRVYASDVSVTFVVIFTALALDLIVAVGVGICLSVVLFVLGMGRDPVRRVYSADRISSKVQRPAFQVETLQREGYRIAVVELHGALFFAACARLEATIAGLRSKGVDFLIFDFRHLTSIDSTGCALVRRLCNSLAESGGKLMLSRVEPERRTDPRKRRQHDGVTGNEYRVHHSSLRWIWLNLEANGVIDVVGPESVFDDTSTALARAEAMLLARLGKSGVPGRRGIIASSAMLRNMTRPQILTLRRYCRKIWFRPGECVFKQGDGADSAYFLVLGGMEVLIDIPSSKRKRRVSSLVEGTLFAEMALLDGGRRSATVQATRRSCCFEIGADEYERLQAEMPELAFCLMKNLGLELSNRLRLANNMISELEQ
ncbi:MAG TPA: hypothetical protein DIW51_06465 [Rhodospirillaceae bacterium]|nr:hypothetical protein [Magnetovibrio sp.]HBT43336.1 hypothetical protein [Rhodospirillaceae bacterium]HCS69597.1 hypothetical protein [Rhodospirillaceae bacterium]